MLANGIYTPATHRDDPETAHAAEQAMNRNGVRYRHKQLVMRAVREEPGLTAPEIGEKTGIGHLAAQRRLSELTGLAIRKGEPRHCRIKKNNLRFTTWWPLENA